MRLEPPQASLYAISFKECISFLYRRAIRSIQFEQQLILFGSNRIQLESACPQFQIDSDAVPASAEIRRPKNLISLFLGPSLVVHSLF